MDVLEIVTSALFDAWFASLDHDTRGRILGRLRKASFGSFGDVRPVGSGVSEMREHFGPGYRIYFKRKGNAVILLLAGGDKSTQAKDIANALRLAKEQ
jgi:putative addiction module killer protein